MNPLFGVNYCVFTNGLLAGSHFNHCIVAIPTAQDTLYVEATSDDIAFDEIHRNLEGTYALVVGKTESRLSRIPVSAACMNSSYVSGIGKINRDGSLDLSCTVEITGNPANNMRVLLKAKNQKEKNDWIIKRLSSQSSSVILKNMRIFNLLNPNSTLQITMDAKLNSFALLGGLCVSVIDCSFVNSLA